MDVGMPRLSDSMEEATVLAWLKSPGDSITRGEPLVEIETDKATIVYEAETDGVLQEILVGAGQVASLGSPIARIRSASAVGRALVASGEAALPGDEAGPTVFRPPAPSAVAERLRATPVARRTAAQLGLSLSDLRGSGPGGRVVRKDVLARQLDRSPAEPSVAGRRRPLTVTQRTIAQRMSSSRQEIPEFTVVGEVDMTAAVAAREQLNTEGESNVSLNDIVLKAVARTLRRFPDLNVSYEDNEVVHHGVVNIGVAVAVDDVLLVPTIFDADKLSIYEIASASRAAVERARSRKASVNELTAATFTVSNLGMFGITNFTAVINPPQAGILAVGSIRTLPRFDETGSVVARQIMELSLSCDHRVVYGAAAARFVAGMRATLENPVTLLLPNMADTTKGDR